MLFSPKISYTHGSMESLIKPGTKTFNTVHPLRVPFPFNDTYAGCLSGSHRRLPTTVRSQISFDITKKMSDSEHY